MSSVCETLDSLSVFLHKFSMCDNPSSFVDHMSIYLNPKSYKIEFLVFFVRVVCFDKNKMIKFQNIEYNTNCTSNEMIRIMCMSDFLLNPDAEKYTRIMAGLDDISRKTIRSLLFESAQEKIRHQRVYDLFKDHNIRVDRFIDADLLYIQNIVFDTTDFEYGIPFIHPKIIDVTITNGKEYFDKMITNKRFAEVVPDDYEEYQIHYSIARGVKTFDANGCKTDCKALTEWFDKQIALSPSVISCAVIVYYSPSISSATISDMIYMNNFNCEIGNVTNEPRWRRMEYVRKYFFNVITPSMNNYTVMDKKTIIFKDISSRFKFNVIHKALKIELSEVRIFSGIISNNNSFVDKYILYDKTLSKFITIVNTRAINRKCREFILYNSKCCRIKKNKNNKIIYYKEPITVKGYFKKTNMKNNIHSRFFIKNILK